MGLSWKEISVDFRHIEEDSILEAWKWIIPEESKLVLVSSIGDMFIETASKEIHWLQVDSRKLEKIAKNMDEFYPLLYDQNVSREWFMFELVQKIKDSGLILEPGMLYSYKKLPILGGEYSPCNFDLCDIEVHFDIFGQIHRQIKDLPDGTKINSIKF